MDVRHLVVSGNSFTQDGIGGVPPTVNSDGGCSFGLEGNRTTPGSWAGYVAQKLQATSLINTAAASHGNQLIANTILEILNRYPYSPGNTAVLFNVSMLTRLDIPCEFENPDRSPFVHWTEDLIPYTYLNRNSRTYQSVEKQVGLDIVPQLSLAALNFLFNYLEHRRFFYAFMLTENYLADPEFVRLVDSRQDRMIVLDPGVGMKEFAEITGHNTENNYHPDRVGRELIADRVVDFIKHANYNAK